MPLSTAARTVSLLPPLPLRGRQHNQERLKSFIKSLVNQERLKSVEFAMTRLFSARPAAQNRLTICAFIVGYEELMVVMSRKTTKT